MVYMQTLPQSHLYPADQSLPSVTEDQWLMCVKLSELQLPHCVQEGADSNNTAPQWLLSVSSWMCFVGVSRTAVDLQMDVNSWNENPWLIGYGFGVDSWALNKEAGVSVSERPPRATDPHHTALIDCNLIFTDTMFCCKRSALQYAAYLSQSTSLCFSESKSRFKNSYPLWCKYICKEEMYCKCVILRC